MVTVNVQDRFREIRNEWGLRDPDEAGSRARLQAVETLASWLEQGQDDPRRVIRSLQVLLAEPELPGIQLRPSVKLLSNAVRDEWATLGGNPEQDLQFLQAMVLAAWPTEAHAVFGLAGLMDSPWEFVQGRERQKKTMEAWRVTRAELPDSRKASDAARQVPVLLAQTLEFTLNSIAGAHQSLDGLFKLQNFPNSVQHQIPDVDRMTQVITELQGISRSTATEVNKRTDRLNRVITILAGSLADATSTPPELPLLWWGQARYSYSAKKPFRRMKNADEVLLYAADEIAERAVELEPEPCCAYLLETLHALGHAINEERTLGDWARGLLEALREAERQTTALTPALEEIVKEDALGLPICWLRLQAGTSAAVEKILSQLEDATCVRLDARLDRGQWASWVLREWLLNQRWAALPATK